jgi:hypothetical protein
MTRFNYGGEPIVTYREIQTSLPIFRTRRKRELDNLPHADVAGYEPYTMRLPYTAEQWKRYKERMEAVYESTP